MFDLGATDVAISRKAPPMGGGDPGVAPSLLKLAHTLRRGDVQAGFLIASEEVSGFRFIRNPETADAFELKREVGAVLERLEVALSTGDAGGSAPAEAARGSLADAVRELAAAEPEPRIVVQRLEHTADRLLEASAASVAARELTQPLGQLTVAAVALWTVAQRLFGV